MKLIIANHGKAAINADYIVSMKCLCTKQLSTGEERYSIVADTINDKNYVIQDGLTENEATRRLDKIANYICSDESFVIAFGENNGVDSCICKKEKTNCLMCDHYGGHGKCKMAAAVCESNDMKTCCRYYREKED